MSQHSQEASSTPAAGSVRITRRQLLLDTLVGLALIGPAVAALASVVRYLIPPARAIAGAAERVQVATTDELADAESKDFVFNDAPYALIHLGDEFRAFDKRCTHLGCIVEWKSDDRIFWCPCHDAVFDANGAVVSGPAPKPLPSLSVEIADGKVYVGA